MSKSPCVFEVKKVSQEWLLDPEEMGSKEKFWYQRPGDNESSWLFKYPRKDTGEHWAEKIAAEVAGLFDIPHARVELAVFGNTKGSATESFVERGEELVHGNQMLAGVVHGYDSEKWYRQSSHTLANIWHVMDLYFVEPEAQVLGKSRIAEYMVFDALVGNTDRHHENWGIVLSRRQDNQWMGAVAPSYDHASSLGRELLDERRDSLLAGNRVGDYVERGHGAIYWSEEDRRGPSPLELVRCATRSYPDLFRPALENLRRMDEGSLIDLVDRVPSNWMSASAREFAIAQLHYNIVQLGGLIL